MEVKKGGSQLEAMIHPWLDIFLLAPARHSKELLLQSWGYLQCLLQWAWAWV